MQNICYRIFLPAQLTYVVSKDGENYKAVKVINNLDPTAEEGILARTFETSVPAKKARYKNNS